MTHPAQSLSIFFPAYNDAGTIASLVLIAHMTARQITDDYEVIVVNDGSPDHTGELLDEMARHFPWLKVVHHARNRGYGGALRTGFETASKDLVFYTDGDAQYDPRELMKLYRSLGPDLDFVNGYKIGRSDPLHRIVIGRVYHWFVRTAFGLRLRDVDCDFRLMRREVFRKVVLTRSSGVICVELMKKVQDHGYRLAEVPVHHYHRTYGKSQFFNFPRVARTLMDLTRLWFELVVRKEHLQGGDQPQSTARSEAGFTPAEQAGDREGSTPMPQSTARSEAGFTPGEQAGDREGSTPMPQSTARSEAGFTPAERRGGLGGATQHPPEKE